MKHRNFLLLLLVFASPAAAQPQSLGIFGTWGAFRGDGGCRAVSEPVEAPRTESWRPFVAISHWPTRRIRGELHVRLSRQKREASAVFLRIDGRSFQLRGGGRDAWAPDGAADAEILAAIRTGINMVVESRAVNGRRFREHYRLQGAATAMDAAAIACAPRAR